MAVVWNLKIIGTIPPDAFAGFVGYWQSARKADWSDPHRQMILNIGDGEGYRRYDEMLDVALDLMSQNPGTVILAEIRKQLREPYDRTDGFLINKMRELWANVTMTGRVYYFAWDNILSGFWCEQRNDALLLKMSMPDMDITFSKEE